MASRLTMAGSWSSCSLMTLALRCVRDGDGAPPGVEVFELPPHETARTSRAAAQMRVVMKASSGEWRGGRRVLLRGGEQHEDRAAVRIDAESGLSIRRVEIAD